MRAGRGAVRLVGPFFELCAIREAPSRWLSVHASLHLDPAYAFRSVNPPHHTLSSDYLPITVKKDTLRTLIVVNLQLDLATPPPTPPPLLLRELSLAV